MDQWTSYPAFLATLISIVALSRIAYQEHDMKKPLPLSELAVSRQPLLSHFRIILLVCGTLFAITMYWFVVPRVGPLFLCAAAWSLTYFGEILLAIFPAHKNTIQLHAIFAKIMTCGMLALTCVFWQSLSGAYQQAELFISLIMTLSVAMVFLDRKRFIFYELLFIFLSHISILIAVLALR